MHRRAAEGAEKTKMDEEYSKPPWYAGVVYICVIGAATVAPFIAHFWLGWIAGLLVWYALVSLYDSLFVPKGALCMGMGFTFPLCTVVALLAIDVLNVIRWLSA